MQNVSLRFSCICLIVICVLFTSTADSEQYVIVEMPNGDRLTGLWRNSTDTHFEIEYNEQVLRFPLEGHTLRFISDLENVPDQVAAKHYRNGRDLLDLEAPELAKRQFEKALEESPKFVDAHYQLGLLYKQDGETEKALQRFKSVALLDAKNYDLVPILREIGETAIAAENYAQTVNAYQLILKHYPEHQSAGRLSYRTGFMLVENLNDTVAGLDLLQKSVEQFHNVSEREKAVYLIGGLQAETGETDKALYTLQQFVRIYPNSKWVNDAHLKRAIIYLQIGERENAVNIANVVLQNTEDPLITEKANEIRQASAWNIFTQDLPDPSIQTVAVDGTSLWIGTPKGVAQIETDGTGAWKMIESFAWMINDSLSKVPDVQTIAVDDSEVWVGTRNQGIIYFNKNSRQTRNYTLNNGLPSMWIRDIKMDNEEIWFATNAGVVRQVRETGKMFHYHGNDPVPNDVHTIALTPEAVWVGTSGDDIAVFNRKIGLWESQRFTRIAQESQIVKFDVVGEQVLFSWYNPETMTNGFFRANSDGSGVMSYSVVEGFEEQDEANDIYVTGTVGKVSPQPPDKQENGEPAQTPQILWVAVNDYVAIYYPHIGEYQGTIGYPKIALEGLAIQCIVVDENRAWIGTTKGMLTIEKQKVTQTSE